MILVSFRTTGPNKHHIAASSAELPCPVGQILLGVDSWELTPSLTGKQQGKARKSGPRSLGKLIRSNLWLQDLREQMDEQDLVKLELLESGI